LYCIVCTPFRICFLPGSRRSLLSLVIDNCIDFVSTQGTNYLLFA
jgi:hypothetical protein